jgi:hypothetical protein
MYNNFSFVLKRRVYVDLSSMEEEQESNKSLIIPQIMRIRSVPMKSRGCRQYNTKFGREISNCGSQKVSEMLKKNKLNTSGVLLWYVQV